MIFSHVLLGSNDTERSRRFYDATMHALGHPSSSSPNGAPRHYYGAVESGTLCIGTPRDCNAATTANGGTIGLAAMNEAAVDGWYAAGIANGGTCDGPPGPRPKAPGNSYGAYLRDPDGNKICAFCQITD